MNGPEMFRYCLLTLSFLVFAVPGPAQMVPDAPIQNFRLPLFGDNGFKVWELRGLVGHYISEDQARVEGLDLMVFSGDEQMALENRIRSPEAKIEFDKSRASGDSSFFMTGPGYEIEGNDWVWEGRENKLRVGRNARVVFADRLNILR
ncbi:MAG: hypothetical protein JJU20_12190 [Opitutales bacterium]|nr:hypothetical protein [Opitutales bacterium]